MFSWSSQPAQPPGSADVPAAGPPPRPRHHRPRRRQPRRDYPADTRRLLRELARAHLITEHHPGRYAFHDLLRAYAAEQAHTSTGTGTGQREATSRMLDHYLHTAANAARLLDPSIEPVALAPPAPGASPGQPADRRQAVAWFEAEHQVLLAAITLAAESGFDAHAWQIPWAISSFLDIGVALAGMGRLPAHRAGRRDPPG